MEDGSPNTSNSTRRGPTLPILEWMSGYRVPDFRADTLAGLTVWALVVPKALAVAAIAGMPPETGLYALPLALLAYAAFGTSRHMSVGPSTTIAIISFAVIYDLADPGTDRFMVLTLMLAVLSGIVLVIAGFLRIGVVADFLSKPVLVGFIIGTAISIIFGQFDKILGFEVDPPDFIPEVLALSANLAETHGVTVIVGLVSLILLFLIEKFAPALPGTIIVVALAIVISALLDLEGLGVSTVYDIPAGFPPLAQAFDIALEDLYALLPGAVTLALVAFIVSIAVANVFAGKHHYEIDPNKELIAMGVANAGSGLSHGFAVEGSGSATATADVAGARTQMTSIIAALLVVATLMFLTPLFRTLPQASLAAVVIHAVWHQIDVPSIRRYQRTKRVDFLAALTALLGVLLLGILSGLLLAVVLSLVSLLVQAKLANHAVLGKLPGNRGYHSVDNYPDAQTFTGLVIFRFDERLFFANASSFRDGVRNAIAADPGVQCVLVDGEGINDIDITGLDMLADLHTELERSGIGLQFAQIKSRVRDLMRRSGLEQGVGVDHFFPSIQAGVDANSGTREKA